MCRGLSPGAYIDLEFVFKKKKEKKSNANLGIKLIVQD